jgi:hypothetical protein
MVTFDYAASAELFVPKRKGGARPTPIRFVVEEFRAARTLGAWMQVRGVRFNGHDIRRLYESTSYSRRRRLRKSG